ncbi:MAG: NYN domain-containing protein [Rhodocyclaceae bacterium]
MAASPDMVSMALFCDFENVALGVRDAKYEKFDIKPVLERLLLKGSIVVKKAYCDWDRYKGFKATMHEANFELIEIPHVRQSGKNSADIRLVVDALDLCYTKSHVDTFVIISGDSDFSPLVSKLRENAKHVIGVGVKQSTSDLLIANCDEFIFYDDLVRESQRSAARRDTRDAPPAPKRSLEEDKRRKEELESRKSKAIELAVATFDALVAERGDSGKIWASMLKEAIKRRKPDFNESYYGFRAFGNLLEEAQARGLLEFGRDEKSGAYVYRSSAANTASELSGRDEASAEAVPTEPPVLPSAASPETAAADIPVSKPAARRKRGGRNSAEKGDVQGATAVAVRSEVSVPASAALAASPASTEESVPVVEAEGGKPAARRQGRGGRKPAEKKVAAGVVAEPVAAVEPQVAAPAAPVDAGAAKKPAARSRRPRKPKAAPEAA